MKPKLVAIFLLLIITPLGVIGWLGVKSAKDEREIVSHRFQELLEGRLADIDAAVAKVIDARERELQRITELESLDATAIRNRVRGERSILQIFVLDTDGKLLHPPLDEPRNQNEEDFLQRTDHIWKSGESFFRPIDPTGEKNAAAEVGAHGWYTWYWGDGVNFIYWQMDSEGRIVGAQVDRVLLLADIVGELPETKQSETNRKDGRIQLVDADSAPVYVWGTYEPDEGTRPGVTRELAPPLGAWRLHYFPAKDPLGEGIGEGIVYTTWLSLGALALAILVLAIYFFRESGRDAREAHQRVTFVNQVSHELKTPLTNIRMYAELLDDQIDEEEETPRRYLDVIVSESQRLSRLIGNVLSFARKQRKKLVVRQTRGSIPETVTTIVEQFRPSLESAGFQIGLDLEEDKPSVFDADALGQIVGNLIGNVEKYAAEGKWIGVASRRAEDHIEIGVADWGPGVPTSSFKAIFEPFVRLSAKVDEGVSGTGIGLPISRDLARLHGGDLTLEPSTKGATFKVRIHAPLETGE